MWILYVIIGLLIIAFYVGCCRYIWVKPDITIENFTLTPYYRDSSCPYILHKHLKRFFERHGFYQGSFTDWKVYFPCDYTWSQKELKKLDDPLSQANPTRWVFVIPGDAYFAGKHNLWNQMVKTHGLFQAKQYLPNTYVFDNPSDMNRLKRDFNSHQLYIMKNNKQRQQGLKITNSWKQIENGKKNKYVLTQELLQDPLLIDGRKINLRIYLLVHCHRGRHDSYLYRDGFVYYTKSKFRKGTMSKDINVTTGYVDRKVYDKNPLTLKDLRRYLDQQTPGLAQSLFRQIEFLMQQVMEAMADKLCPGMKYYEHHMFQLFGVDLAVSNSLEPKVLEINKGPDLESKDKRDGKLKDTLLDDVFKVVGFHPKGQKGHDFTHIWTNPQALKMT